MFFNIPLYIVKSSLNTEKIHILGIPVASIYNSEKYDYKRKKINICGIKFTYKSKIWKKSADEQNKNLNKINLNLEILHHKNNNKNILFTASNFVKAGGIETRMLQYISKLTEAGWNVYLLSENNSNKSLLKLTNFYLNFDAPNFNNCLNEIIDKYNINIIEFQFKNPKILKNIDLFQLKSKIKTGCVVHNLGIKDTKIINKFDYKIIVSKYMYENFYKKTIKDVDIIQNSMDTSIKNDLPIWEYKNQKNALLVSRIASDKMKSIECFIRYCKKNNINFKIAGEEQYSGLLKNKIIKKFNLPQETFIGEIDTMTYLSSHCNDFLFVGGVGLVILESLYLGYPAFCCSDYKNGNYSFITKTNMKLFDNFTIRNQSIVSKLHKKAHLLDIRKISDYYLRDYIIQHRDLNNNFKVYLDIITGKNN